MPTPPPPPPGPVAVLGAGIAGLAAAWTLHRAGVEVELFEASDRVGGVIRSHRAGGFLAEEGPHSLARPSPRVLGFFRDAGLADHMVRADPERSARFIVRGGAPHPLPTSPGTFLRTPLLSVGGRLRVIAEPLRRRTRPPEGDESVADVLRRRGLGDEVVSRFLDPFVAGVYAGDPERLSAPHAFPLLRELEEQHGSLVRGLVARLRAARRTSGAGKEDGDDPDAGGGHAAILSFRQGMEALPRGLAEALPARGVHRGARVQGLENGPGGWRVRTEEGEAEGFRAVVSTLPAPALARVVPGAGEAITGALEGVRHPPIALLSLGFRRADVAHPLDGFGMLVPAVEGRQVLGALFPSTLFPGRAPEGHVLVSSFVGGTRQPELAGEAAPAMEARVLEELGALLGVRGEPVFRHLKVWERSIPQVEVGYGAVREAARALEEARPGLVLAGSWVGGVSLADALVSGLDAAARVLEAGAAGG